MKKKIIKIGILIFSIIAIDYLVGILGSKVIDKVIECKRPSQAALIAYNLNKADADIVIVGSSTATCHIVPSIISDSLSQFSDDRLTCFNAGAYYQGIPYCLAVLKGVFSRCSPKCVIMDVQLEHLFGQMQEEQKKPLRPYYKYNQNIKKLLDKNAPTLEKLKLHSNLYCFNMEIIKLLASLRSSSDVDGFDMHRERLSAIDANKLTENTINVDINKKPICVDELLEIFSLCKNNNCDLFIVISPYLYQSYSCDYYLDYLNTICFQNNITILNHLGDKNYQDYTLFRDIRHMNYFGAEKFTSDICLEIQKTISL